MGEYTVTKLVMFVCFEQIQQICMRLETDIFIIELIYIYIFTNSLFSPRLESIRKGESRWKKVCQKEYSNWPSTSLGQQRQTSVWTVVNHPLPQLAIRQTRTRRKKESAKNILGIGTWNLVNEQLFPFPGRDQIVLNGNNTSMRANSPSLVLWDFLSVKDNQRSTTVSNHADIRIYIFSNLFVIFNNREQSNSVILGGRRVLSKRIALWTTRSSRKCGKQAAHPLLDRTYSNQCK